MFVRIQLLRTKPTHRGFATIPIASALPHDSPPQADPKIAHPPTIFPPRMQQREQRAPLGRREQAFRTSIGPRLQHLPKLLVCRFRSIKD